MVHIFRAGPMCSLRGALLQWLLPVFLLVGGASAGVAYWNFNRMASTFMDDQMELLAESTAAQGQDITLPALSGTRVHKGGSYVVQVFDAAGQLRTSSLPVSAVGLQASAGFHDVSVGNVPWRVYTTSADGAAKARRVQVLQSGEFRRHVATGQAWAAMAPVIVLLPLSVLILWCVVAMASREVGAIARQTSAQDEHTIAELPLTRVPREIAPMVVSFNSLLTRLRDAFATQRRFVQDAAHELRTPITAVALQLENVRCDLPPGACQQSFAQLEAGVGRAQRLVDQLLKLSRQEAKIPEAPVVIDVYAQLHESISGLISLADQRGIDLGLVAAPAAPTLLTLSCVAADLRSVLDNLIENALRYTPEGGVVDVRLSGESGRPVVEVMDTGPGIPPDQLDRVFDRFFRVPGSDVRGSGLGLAIAQAAAQRCGLRVTLRNREDRSGLIARIALS